MLELNTIREHKDTILTGLAKRNWNPEQTDIIDDIINMDDERKAMQNKIDNLLSRRKQLSKSIGKLIQSNRQNDAEKAKNEVAVIKGELELLQARLSETLNALNEALVSVPNTPHKSVKAGKGEEDNEVYQSWDNPFPEKELAHWEIAKKHNLIDFELGVKITGSGFPLYRGKGAKLQRALINFFLDEGTKAGYEEVLPPLLVNAASAHGTGQLPDKEGQMYHITLDDLYLVPTAEVPVTNILRDVILRDSDLPIKLTAYTPCFRREAGSYGAHVKGLNRVHQFDKVEIVQVSHPDNSYQALDEMLNHVRSILDQLELPYRILRLCGGDLGFTSALTYDFEVFSSGQNRWLEVSSVSNFETYQSKRLKLRFRNAAGKSQLAHTLNGSALALPRIMAAFLEYYQEKDGIFIPKVLQPYTGFERI